MNEVTSGNVNERIEGRRDVLTGVLAGAVHGRHPGALLAGGAFPQGQVDDVDQGELLVVPQHVGIDVVIDTHGLCRGRR